MGEGESVIDTEVLSGYYKQSSGRRNVNLHSTIATMHMTSLRQVNSSNLYTSLAHTVNNDGIILPPLVQ